MTRFTGLRVLLCLALPLAAAANGPVERGDGAWRLPGGDSASEYWDLLVRLDSGHRVFARFLVTNEGPGSGSAAAFGHVILPDGRSVRFDNAKRSGDWEISSDGRRIRISSSILDQSQDNRRKFEYDSNKRGVKLHLWFEPGAGLSHPGHASLRSWSSDLLDESAPVRGTLWLRGMQAPLEVAGTLGLTHTWMERSESELAARRIEFFSLEDASSLYLSLITTPRGELLRWLVARRGAQLLYAGDDFEVELEEPAGAGDYPLPPALRLRGPGIEGSIRLAPRLLEDQPFEALPQPFRFLLSLKASPRRVWTDSPFEVKIGVGGADAIFRGSGITSVTFPNPFPPQLLAPRG